MTEKPSDFARAIWWRCLAVGSARRCALRTGTKAAARCFIPLVRCDRRFWQNRPTSIDLVNPCDGRNSPLAGSVKLSGVKPDPRRTKLTACWVGRALRPTGCGLSRR